MRNDTGIDELKLLAEQLRLARTFLGRRSPVEAKVTIILLDSMADSLMYRRCRSEFEEDTFLAVIQRPRFSRIKRSEALRDFRAKVNLLCSVGFMTHEDSTVLKIGHSYRNAAYHRDVHNLRVTHEIGRLLFMSVCNLVKSYYKNGISAGGLKSHPWLADYGLRSDFIEFESAARTIVTQLAEGVSMTLTTARIAFQEDINVRLRKIEQSIQKLPSWCVGAKLDEGLKWAEFGDEHPKEQFFEDLWEMNYKITSGNESAVNHRDYRIAESKAEKLMEEAFKKFVPICSRKLLRQLNRTSAVKGAKTIPALLSAYQNLDSQLSQLEASVEQIATSIERAEEIENDIRRGK